MTTLIIIIVSLCITGVFGYALKRIFDILREQSLFIMAVKNEGAVSAVTTASLAEKNLEQKIGILDKKTLGDIASSEYLSGEISDELANKLGI